MCANVLQGDNACTIFVEGDNIDVTIVEGDNITIITSLRVIISISHVT